VPFPGQVPDREGLKHAISIFLSTFSDIQWVIEEQIAKGQEVVGRFPMIGTQRGEILGIPPTGKLMEVWGFVIDRVKDGKFAESRIIRDMLSLMQQPWAISIPEGA
jgi:predicted ester cyclase